MLVWSWVNHVCFTVRGLQILDHYFGNVCELDLVFGFHKVYCILDEFIIGGEIQETSKKVGAKASVKAGTSQLGQALRSADLLGVLACWGEGEGLLTGLLGVSRCRSSSSGSRSLTRWKHEFPSKWHTRRSFVSLASLLNCSQSSAPDSETRD